MEKCQKCFKGAIKACDGFGTFITFRINDDIEYKSIIGGCSTILFVIITIISSLLVLFIQHTAVLVFFQEKTLILYLRTKSLKQIHK